MSTLGRHQRGLGLCAVLCGLQSITMNESDYRCEQALRALTRSKAGGAREAALVLADFYDERGQPSRAQLWRRPRPTHAQRLPADDLNRNQRDRRKTVMWLIEHVLSVSAIASAFRSSLTWTRALIYQVEAKIRAAANEERHHPTMAATQRLQAAGALPSSYARGTFVFGEEPPESWPITRPREKRKP